MSAGKGLRNAPTRGDEVAIQRSTAARIEKHHRDQSNGHTPCKRRSDRRCERKSEQIPQPQSTRRPRGHIAFGKRVYVSLQRFFPSRAIAEPSATLNKYVAGCGCRQHDRTTSWQVLPV